MDFTEHPGRSRHDVAVGAADVTSPAVAVAVAGKSAPAVGEQGTANPSALTAEQLSRLLAASGSKSATAEVIRRHIEAGAPTVADGRLNLIHYVAWVVREVANVDDEK